MTEPKLKPEVVSDGRSVWVNSHRCLARFCPISFELFLDDPRKDVVVRATEDRLADWENFKTMVFKKYQVVVADRHRPTYI